MNEDRRSQALGAPMEAASRSTGRLMAAFSYPPGASTRTVRMSVS